VVDEPEDWTVFGVQSVALSKPDSLTTQARKKQMQDRNKQDIPTK